MQSKIILFLFLALPAIGQPDFQQAIQHNQPLPWLATQQYALQNTDSCLQVVQLSLRKAGQRRDSLTTARAMCLMSWIYLVAYKDEAKAIEWANRVMTIAKLRADYGHLTAALQLLLVISFHQQMGNPDELVARGLAYVRKTDDWFVQKEFYATLTVYQQQKKQYAQAEQTIRHCMAISRPHDKAIWFTFGLDYGELLQMQGKHAPMRAFVRQLASHKNQISQRPGHFVYDNDMARLALLQQDYAKAEQYLQTGLTLQKQQAKPDTLQQAYYYQNLIRLYSLQGQYQKAWQTERIYGTLRLALQRMRQTRDSRLQMTQLKATADLAKKQVELDLMAERGKQQQFFLLGVGLVALLLIGFGLIQHRTRQRIEHQKDELSQLNQAKDKLFAILSHDLRSPVANLYSNVTLTQWGGLSQQAFSESVQDLGSDLSNLRAMLDNVLHWSVSQMGGLRASLTLTRLQPIIQNQADVLKPIADSKGVQLAIEVPNDAHLLADPNHLAILVRNLLQNGLKFTATGGMVALTYSEEADGGCLVVRDTGIGMNPDQVASLFQAVTQKSRSGTANEPGTGLGLMLVNELVRANKGRIEVSSVEGQGTSFTLWFSTHETKPRSERSAIIFSSPRQPQRQILYFYP